MKYTDYESYWQWLAIEQPMEREEEDYEYCNKDLTPDQQWLAIEQPMERGE